VLDFFGVLINEGNQEVLLKFEVGVVWELMGIVSRLGDRLLDPIRLLQGLNELDR
jgi:hypothetical protein